ncbi:iron ABC transporter permease [Methylopila jiangsuensis]|uniref:Iron ABC transporter permease n=1 Tax=Methylopila jiangsuensis TaxID=586230 RepID=A0A9W6JH94_9HYPH|nr:iron chelate uptake ABC transporter family permease subunit [Methylopila jiangsuensis]MDR6285016.1 iron complex transport system permease protein [Methylopila jiangsuensis]GLK77595.1 iron ABC transporter permease [Methylopila jiangsuensis]
MTALAAPRLSRPGLAAGAALVLLATLSLLVGVIDVSPARLMRDPEAWELIFASRLPRTLAAILAGAGLGVAGLVMQALSRNRFVESTTAGTDQSAAAGVLLMTILFPAAALPVKTLGAAAAALAGTSVFLAIAQRLPPSQPYLVPLFGLIYGSVIGSAALFVAWQTDLVQYFAVWTRGEFSGVLRGRYELLWISAVMVGVAWWAADRLTILSLGRDVSTGLGLDYAAMMRLGLVIVSVISALTVVVVGAVPFVGLVAPNLVTRLIGDDLRHAAPWTAFVGASLTLVCDLIGRVIRFPYEIPVGVVMGVVGALLFLWLLFGRRARG